MLPDDSLFSCCCLDLSSQETVLLSIRELQLFCIHCEVCNRPVAVGNCCAPSAGTTTFGLFLVWPLSSRNVSEQWCVLVYYYQNTKKLKQKKKAHFNSQRLFSDFLCSSKWSALGVPFSPIYYCALTSSSSNSRCGSFNCQQLAYLEVVEIVVSFKAQFSKLLSQLMAWRRRNWKQERGAVKHQRQQVRLSDSGRHGHRQSLQNTRAAGQSFCDTLPLALSLPSNGTFNCVKRLLNHLLLLDLIRHLKGLFLLLHPWLLVFAGGT